MVFWYLIISGRVSYLVYAYLHVGTRVIDVNILSIVFDYYDCTPTPSFTSRVMHLCRDWMAPLHQQHISGADAAAALRAGLRSRKVITMSRCFLYIASAPACVMRKVDTSAPTPVLTLLTPGNSRGLCTGGDVFSFRFLVILEYERKLVPHFCHHPVIGTHHGFSRCANRRWHLCACLR